MKGTKSKEGKKSDKANKNLESCSLCSYTTFENYRMKRHMRIHTGEKPYMCGMCDQSFTQKSSLKEHLWKHTALRSSTKCTLCTAIFNQPQDVKTHMTYMHTAGELMSCTICSAEFTDRYSLTQHQKLHDNVYRYQCLECAFSARDKNKIMLHMGVHSKRKPLKCSTCRDVFKYQHNLLDHLQKKHGVHMFGDSCSAQSNKSVPNLDKATPESDEAMPQTAKEGESLEDKKMTDQQTELEQQYQIMDEQGNTLQLSEADAAAIHSAMQQSTADGTLQIVQGDEGTITVTVLTVAHSLDGTIQDIEQNVGVLADADAEEQQQLMAIGEGLEEAGLHTEQATIMEVFETGDEVATEIDETASQDVPSTSTE